MADDGGDPNPGGACGENLKTPAETGKTSGSAVTPRTGIISRIWNGVFGRSEDFEKKLQHLSKEEAAVHARIRRRGQSWRATARNIISLSVVLEVCAVVYAILATRTLGLNWKMRALRVLPMFLLPGLSFFVYSTLSSFTRMRERKDQKTLERLRAERQAKIDELKERTNYYITQQLIQRYDLDPAAKAAAASVLAHKLGSDSGLKVYVEDETEIRQPTGKSNDVQVVQSSGLRNRRQGHSRSSSSGSVVAAQIAEEKVLDYVREADMVRRENQPSMVEHYQQPANSSGGWFARIAALLVGEDPTQCFALICGNCHIHNGLARKEDFPYITYYCPHCNALNGPPAGNDVGPGPASCSGSGSISDKVGAQRVGDADGSTKSSSSSESEVTAVPNTVADEISRGSVSPTS